MSILKAFAFGAVNDQGDPESSLLLRAGVSPATFRDEASDSNPLAHDDAEQNQAHFQRILRSPDLCNRFAAEYRLGYPKQVSLVAGEIVELTSSDEPSLELARLLSSLGPVDLSKNKERHFKGTQQIEPRRPQLKFSRSIQRIIVCVELDNPHVACALEVIHQRKTTKRDTGKIGTLNLLFLPTEQH